MLLNRLYVLDYIIYQREAVSAQGLQLFSEIPAPARTDVQYEQPIRAETCGSSREKILITFRRFCLLPFEKAQTGFVKVLFVPPTKPQPEPVGPVESHSKERRRCNHDLKVRGVSRCELSKIARVTPPRPEPLRQWFPQCTLNAITNFLYH